MKPGTIVVKVADLNIVSGDGELATLGLGSCVAICLHDPVAKVAGMAHVLLPNKSLSRNAENPAKFPQSAIPLLVEKMEGLGAQKSRLTARLVGGASMFGNLSPSGAVQMGERNVVASRQVLEEQGIKITAEDTGGTTGRSIRLQAVDGALFIRTLATGERPL
ncbi:MAG TPA: chemotaxis protein CheD [Gemmatimonadales bacterium]|nr:chemotaxis protein CheD [Gemmatimonadales bacterium]